MSSNAAREYNSVKMSLFTITFPLSISLALDAL